MSGLSFHGDNNNSKLFETHLARLSEPARSVMLELRAFAKSLGSNVIEEVRPHRVVYAKTLNFRTFLDVRPAPDFCSLVVEIKSGRTAPPLTLTIKTLEDAAKVKPQISQAFQKIQ